MREQYHENVYSTMAKLHVDPPTVIHKVYNLSAEVILEFMDVSAREAVILAYAHSIGDYMPDFNAYDHLVTIGQKTIACGDYCTLNREKKG